MESFLQTLAAAAVAGMIGMAIYRPLLFWDLRLGMLALSGIAAVLGTGIVLGGNPRLGLLVVGGACFATALVLLLNQLARHLHCKRQDARTTQEPHKE